MWVKHAVIQPATVRSGGCLCPFGGAQSLGDLCNNHLNQPIVGIAVRANGAGYWMVASDGGIFAFDAPFEGSTGGMQIDSPIAGMAATPSDAGYWLTTEDGTVYPFGDATGQLPTGHDFAGLPVSGMAANPAGPGYWQVDLNADLQATGRLHLSRDRLSRPIGGLPTTRRSGSSAQLN